MASTLKVDRLETLAGSGNITVATGATFSGNVTFSGGGTVSGTTTFTNSTVTGNTTFSELILSKSVVGTTNTATVGSTTADSTVTLNFDQSQNFVLTLANTISLANPSTEALGQSGFIVFIQDGSGNRSVTLGTDYETAGAAGITLSTSNGDTDVVPYIVIASNRILLGTPQLAFG